MIRSPRGKERTRRFEKIALVLALGFAAQAKADVPEESTFAEARKDLEEGRIEEALARYESLADRGYKNPSVSMNRGIAYAKRAASSAQKPGDLGQAACAFAEARALTGSRDLQKRAEQAEGAIQRELARKLARTGGATLMAPPAPLSRQFVETLPAWGFGAVAGAGSLMLVLGAVLLLQKRRYGALVSGAGTLFFTLGLAGYERARSFDTSEDDACVISANASLSKKAAFGSGGEPLREGAHVKIVKSGSDDTFASVRWGSLEGFVPQTQLRRLARP